MATEITVRIADAPRVVAILEAAGELALKVDWFLGDMAGEGPTDPERVARGCGALNMSYVAFRAAVRENGGTI